MTSSLVIFRAYLFTFFVPHDPKSEKNPENQLIKNSGLIRQFCLCHPTNDLFHL